jgi:transcriptional regulator of nitric oxide reductase
MSHSHSKDWENLVERAEVEPDLKKVRQYVEEIETAMVLQGIDRFSSRKDEPDSATVRNIKDRLRRIKVERLKWPLALLDGVPDGT